MRKIKFYQINENRKPIVEFLDCLNDKQIEKVFWVFDLVEELKQVPKEYLKKLVNTEDLWEVRVKFGNNAFRFLGFFEKNDLIILNHAFIKKNQKIPKQEIRIAVKRKEDYYRKYGK